MRLSRLAKSNPVLFYVLVIELICVLFIVLLLRILTRRRTAAIERVLESSELWRVRATTPKNALSVHREEEYEGG